MDYKVEAGILNLAIGPGSRELWTDPLSIYCCPLTPHGLGEHCHQGSMSTKPNCAMAAKINMKQMIIKRSPANLGRGPTRNLARGRGPTSSQAP